MLEPQLSTANLLFALSGFSSLWAIKAFINYKRLLRAVNYTPGPKTHFSEPSLISTLLPRIPGIVQKHDWPWVFKYTAFEKYGRDLLAGLVFWPSARVLIHVADSDVAKEVTSHRAAFPKPVAPYKIANYFGLNILSTEGEEWWRHRKAIQRSFSEQNNKLVWRETVNTILELFTIWDEEMTANQVFVPGVADLTRSLTLMVISVTGFGMKLPWKNDGPLL
ncbi:hypothetical protein PIIN_08002 [Serendipita indica DSM 11827]|uniref:Cytochrome P450 n=1 Tax=Serendipita indica (strain DSM 11827) TaxID=1109443 RepID=G4TRU9_SERID|nr:hypothetical protein PIIN_08002 [Serendipita indica DSM 11827]